MEMRKFGKTNLETSAVVFGGGFVGGIIIHADDDTRRKAIRMALDGRINWIDTAPIYGQGKSEEALGWLLEEVDEEPIISTKVYLDTNHLEDIPGQFKESIGKSLSRLRRDSVDVLHLHNPITNKGGGKLIGLHHILKSGGVLDALEEMVEKNLTKYIGITGLGDSKCCQEVIETGRIDSIQVYYNMINASAAYGPNHNFPGQDFSGLLEACQKYGVGTMGIRVFAAGILATDKRHGREIIITDNSDLSSEEQRALDVFTKLDIDDEGNTPYGTRAQTALRYVLSEPKIDNAIVGLAELSHLNQVLEASELGPLPEIALEKMIT